MQTDHLIARLIAPHVLHEKRYEIKSLTLSICCSTYLESGPGPNREYWRLLVRGSLLESGAEAIDALRSIITRRGIELFAAYFPQPHVAEQLYGRNRLQKIN